MENYSGYLGILRWSLRQQGDETGPSGGAPTRRLTDEDKEFLMKAIKEYTVDIPQRMRMAVSVMEVKEEGQEEEKVNEIVNAKLQALTEVFDYCEDLDNAKMFLDMGGLKVLLDHLAHPHAGIRAQCCAVVAVSLQNEPKVQAGVLELDGVPRLIKAVREDEDDAVRVQAFSALSALVRGHDTCVKAFLEHGGGTLTAGLASDEVPRLRRKALFLSQALLRSVPDAAGQLVEGGVAAAAVRGLSSGDVQEAENSLNVLHMAVRRAPGVVTDVDAEALQQGVAAYVQQLVNLAKEDGESNEQALAQDEVKHAKAVLQAILGARAARSGGM